MAERKVLNKYYPPDFDPAKIPKRRKPKNRQINVRNMLTMRIRCKRCGNYSNEGTKFNMRKEVVIGERYLDEVPIFRFYFKCKMCSTEITMKTDPQNSNYTIESGAERYSGEAMCEEKRWKRDAEERGDSMKSLENRTLDSKREMDILSNLDEIKSMNSRRAHVSNNAMLEALQRPDQRQQKELEEEDEAMIKYIWHRSKENIRRIDDDNLDDTYDSVVSGLNGRRTSQTGSKKRKVSKSQPDFLSKTSTHDELNYKKEHQSGENVLKSSVIKFTPIKKSSKPKAQASEEEKKKTSITRNVSKSLHQQYDEE
ncbi:coiled-coil domain-containing protein 94 [Tanacetum coccineum]|uniref:Splicing factor YJU2 n=1 Tax=Tanacetum coccineum TaxID=301880 RepID=A0ABQ5BYQ2_9ASTR